jgi:hypothetical protein
MKMESKFNPIYGRIYTNSSLIKQCEEFCKAKCLY